MEVYCDNDNCKWHARQPDLDYSLHFNAESQPIAFFEAPWNFASDGPAWIERVKHAQQNCDRNCNTVRCCADKLKRQKHRGVIHGTSNQNKTRHFAVLLFG